MHLIMHDYSMQLHYSMQLYLLLGECRALWGSHDVTACQYSSEGWAVYENGQSHDQHCWKQVCDRRGLLLAEPFSVSVSASNVVVRISMKLLKDDF